MNNTQTKPVKASSIRRALTTLQKAGFITKSGYNNTDFTEGKVTIVIRVDSDLIQPKKRIRQSQTKKTKQ